MKYLSEPNFYVEISHKDGHWVAGNFRDFTHRADIFDLLADFLSGRRTLRELANEARYEAREYWWLE